MTRLSMALLGVGVLVIPLVGAHAANLEVDGGVIQSFTIDVDIEVEPPPTVAVTVQVREYAGKSGNARTVWDAGTYTLAEGQDYWVEYDAATRDCDSSITTPHQQAGGPFTASVDLTHVLCVQQGQTGEVTLRAGAADGPIVEPTVTSSGISSAPMAEEETPSPVTEQTVASPTPEPTVESREAPTPEPTPSEPEPEPEPSPEDAPTPTEPAVTEPDEPTEAPEPQPCAWEVHEDEDGRTYLVEICPEDDATASTEDEDAS